MWPLAILAALALLCILAIPAVSYLRRRLRAWKASLRSEIVTDFRASVQESEARLEQRLRALADSLAFERVIRSVATAARAKPEPPRSDAALENFRQFLLTLDSPDDGWRYLEIHGPRIYRTLSLVPPPARTGRALELGVYLQMTPTLACVLGYREVRGAYLGEPGQTVTRSVTSQGREIFRCEVDLFNAEFDPYPYPDGHFDVVLACEILEHLNHDPMHMLVEIHRVLDDGGAVILTTPNVASFTSIARTFESSGNPQIFSQYSVLRAESGHVREYTPQELERALEAAGFAIEALFTEKLAGHNADVWVRPLLQRFGFPDSLRGEQIYCVARKRSGAPITRYPAFLYEQRS